MSINVKKLIIVSILTFMGTINFMLSYVLHEKRFITSGSDSRLDWEFRAESDLRCIS